jgi:HPt (histidine-containing phosphotransfer) domain-containing protein
MPAKKLLTNGAKQEDAGALLGHGIHRIFVPCGASSRSMKRLMVGENVMAASSPRRTAGSDPGQAVIDEAHLGRMTLGDRLLEREILEIFVRQAAIMLERIAGAEPALAAASAHTLTGSARGIGAWRVAQAAERLERAATEASGLAEREEAVEDLKAATLEASAAIGARLGGEWRGH